MSLKSRLGQKTYYENALQYYSVPIAYLSLCAGTIYESYYNSPCRTRYAKIFRSGTARERLLKQMLACRLSPRKDY